MDEIITAVAEGLDPDEAAQILVEVFGRPGQLGLNYNTLNRRAMTRLLSGLRKTGGAAGALAKGRSRLASSLGRFGRYGG